MMIRFLGNIVEYLLFVMWTSPGTGWGANLLLESFFFFFQSGLLLCLLIAVFRDWITFLWVFRTTGGRVAAVWWSSITCLLWEVDVCLWTVESSDDWKIVKMLAWLRLIWLRTLYWNIVARELSIRTTSDYHPLKRQGPFPCFKEISHHKIILSIEGMQYLVSLKKIFFFNGFRWYQCCFI